MFFTTLLEVGYVKFKQVYLLMTKPAQYFCCSALFLVIGVFFITLFCDLFTQFSNII